MRTTNDNPTWSQHLPCDKPAGSKDCCGGACSSNWSMCPGSCGATNLSGNKNTKRSASYFQPTNLDTFTLCSRSTLQHPDIQTVFCEVLNAVSQQLLKTFVDGHSSRKQKGYKLQNPAQRLNIFWDIYKTVNWPANWPANRPVRDRSLSQI